MSTDQIIVFAALGLALFLFSWGKIRHDFTALIILFFLVITGVIPAPEAFSGFGHPAVITVACVLMIGRGLQRSGVVDILGQFVTKAGSGFIPQIVLLCVITAGASAFMNNVGALAIMMPVAIQLARKSGHALSKYLMPIAFSSLLGGMTTLIGTPPNIIIATIRAEISGEAFGMFHFTSVGFFIAAAGVAYISLAGWRLIPLRSSPGNEANLFRIEDYITEVRIVSDSELVGATVGRIRDISGTEITLLGLVRRKQRIHAPSPDEVLLDNDILILETDAEELKTFIDNTGTRLLGGKRFHTDAQGSSEIEVAEVVIMRDSPLIGQSAVSISMRSRYGLNLLAVSRREKRLRKRLDKVIFRTGDVLMLQGRSHMLHDMISTMKCLPLAKRELNICFKRQRFLALGIFVLSILLVAGGFLSIQIAFSMAALAFVLTGLLPVKEVYTSVDWPVIVLLGAMLPVGHALGTTGGASVIASQILLLGGNLPPWAILGIVLIVTMLLTDIINNAATVVLMAPIGISVALGIQASPDAFLMAVAIGGSCAFLTPIGHQSNTLVMGPGGYRFTDYWRMGLLLDVLIVLIGVPLILHFWPL